MENKEIEEWRSIEGYEGLYQVSSLGRVRSLDRLVNFNGGIGLRKGRILRPGKDRYGYLQVLLCKDGKPTMFKVHRLVGITFQDICGQFREGLQVDHINTVRTDNRAVNLRWCTSKENQNNTLTRQHNSNAKKGENHPMYGKFGKKHPSSKPIIQLDLESNFIAEFEGLLDAERKLGICHSMISSCCRGKTKTTKGFIFRYKTA